VRTGCAYFRPRLANDRATTLAVRAPNDVPSRGTAGRQPLDSGSAKKGPRIRLQLLGHGSASLAVPNLGQTSDVALTRFVSALSSHAPTVHRPFHGRLATWRSSAFCPAALRHVPRASRPPRR
jgi:hypothetical protein